MILKWKTRDIGARIGRLSVETILSWFMKISFIGIVPYLIHKGNRLLDAGQIEPARDSFVVAGGAIVAFIVSLTPSLIERSAQITLPWIVDFMITLVLYLHVALGGAVGLYYMDLYIPYDKVLHFFSTIMISVLAFMIVFTLYYTRRIRLNFFFLGLLIVMTAMTLGSIWEILEFTLDKLAGSRSQGGLDDTMMDIIMDFFGGTITAVCGSFYAKYSKPRHLRKFAIPIAQLFGYIPRRRAFSGKTNIDIE